MSVSPSARNWSYKARWSQEGEEEEIADNWEKMASSSEENLKQQLQELQKQLGKKQMFEEAVLLIKSLLVDHYPSSSPSLRKLVSNFSFPFLFFNSRFMYNCLISKFSNVLEDFEWIGCCNLYSLRRSLSFVFFFCSIKSHKSWVNFEVSKLDIYFFRLKNEETLIEEIKNKNFKPPALTLKNFSLN